VSINTSGKWWIGNEPVDIREFLKAYASQGYKVDEFRLARCDCSSEVFYLDADGTEGAAKRQCVKCGAEHFICDSEEYWEETGPERCTCVECGGESVNVGVGFSLYKDAEDVRWLYVGVRCVACGILGCFADWKVAYGPSHHLLNSV
jgi:hypothetical protein